MKKTGKETSEASHDDGARWQVAFYPFGVQMRTIKQ
jgi:hypothetical protein